MNEPVSRPVITVATVVERDGTYLLVEEETRVGLRLNQPAGHLERGEAITAGAARETLEETGWDVDCYALVGVYRWEAVEHDATYVRMTFAARPRQHHASRPLDEGIVRVVWMTYDEMVESRARHRSPLVLRCVEDYRRGRRVPLDALIEVNRDG